MLLRGKRSRYRTQPQIEAFQGNREPRFFFSCQILRHSKEIESQGFFLMLETQVFEGNKERKVFSYAILRHSKGIEILPFGMWLA